MNNILRITDPVLSDDSIDKCEHIEYNPVVGANLNSGILGLILKLKIFLHIPVKVFYL